MERFGLTTSTFGKHQRYKLEILRLSTLTKNGSSIAHFGGISTSDALELQAGTNAVSVVLQMQKAY